MSNCRINDLAFIRGLPAPISEANDRIVRLVAPGDFNGELTWSFEKPVEFVILRACRCNEIQFYTGDTAVLYSLQDKYLRPLRGDETPSSSTTDTTERVTA